MLIPDNSPLTYDVHPFLQEVLGIGGNYLDHKLLIKLREQKWKVEDNLARLIVYIDSVGCGSN